MTSRGRGDGDPPPRPEAKTIVDDPLLRPASNAGSDDDRPSSPRAPAGTAPSGTAAASLAKPPTVTGAPPPSSTGGTPPSATSTSPARSTSAPPPAPASEEPLLPATYHENDLRSAVGASPLAEPLAGATRKRRAPASDRRQAAADDGDGDGDAPHAPRNRKTIAVAAVSITVGLAVAALVFLGHANSERYLLTCEAERAVVEQGRSFPPWGTRPLAGEAWRPLTITPETRCRARETDDPLDLARWYLAMILDQATALLTAREVTKLDDAEVLLKQALLLTRPPEHEPEQLARERDEHRTEIERLLGDVTYGRAAAKLHAAEAALGDAAEQHPRHASDSAAWAAYARQLARELHAGPAGAPPSAFPPAAAPAAPAGSATEHPNVPVGVALPVEPARGSADAPVSPVPPVSPASPASPAPTDAGVPSGGVLL